jgi:3-oxoadipate enol-lactonase
MAEIDLGDVTIHYETVGDERRNALIFCHGLGGSGARFVEDFDFWGQHFRTVAWDNRGLGESSAADRYSLPLYASDLARLMDHLEIDRALIHGVSWGGVLLQQFALDHPEKCAAIILDSTSSEVNVAASENWYQRGEVARLGSAVKLSATAPAFEGHTQSAARMLESGRQIEARHLDSFVAECRAVAGLREHPFTPRLSEIRCPALVVGGGKDATAGAGGSVIMARHLADAKLEIFQDAGHGIYGQRKEEFRELLLAFARRNHLV